VLYVGGINNSNNNHSRGVQIFDLLLLSRHEKEHRDQCKEALAFYDEWKNDGAAIKSFMMGRILRRKAEAAVQSYKAVRRQRIRLFQNYMAALPPVITSGY
jgi:hypothetical protein